VPLESLGWYEYYFFFLIVMLFESSNKMGVSASMSMSMSTIKSTSKHERQEQQQSSHPDLPHTRCRADPTANDATRRMPRCLETSMNIFESLLSATPTMSTNLPPP
jgi:hypothetical protein